MIESKLVEYKFKSVYQFVNIIYEAVEAGTDFWNFDGDQFVQSALKFNEKSLLHIYVTSSLYNHYSNKYHEGEDDNEGQEIYWWIELMKEYDIVLTDEDYNSEHDNSIYDWFQANEMIFKQFFEVISNEVVHVLFSNKQFLVKFNRLVRNVIKDGDGTYEKNIKWPENSRKADGTIKRYDIPIWVKRAVFYRDMGRCVFCNCNLGWAYHLERNANFDHIVPLKDYGTNDPCNIQLTCEHCNKRKGAKELVPNYTYHSWW